MATASPQVEKAASRRSRASGGAPKTARRPRVNSLAEGVSRDSATAKAAAPEGKPETPSDKGSTRTKSSAGAGDVPDWVRSRFVQVGKAYFFPDGAPAFEDRGRRLTTQSENLELVRSLIHIAKGRGWNTVVASGTARFRQIAWQLGEREGLNVQGYRPSAVERAKALRLATPAPGEASPSATLPAEPTSTRNQAQRPPEQARTSIPLIKGDLLEHGRANYRNEPGGRPSYFVRLRTANGERTIWGIDLDRALRESSSHPQIGDAIGLQPQGRERVTVSKPAANEKGEVVGEEPVRAHRSRWSIERLEVFENRRGASQTFRNAALPPSEAVQRHPELVDAYVHLKAAEELAKRHMVRQEDRDRFVMLVRSALGSAIEGGESVPAARLKVDRVPRSSRQSRDPVQELVR